MATGEVLDTGMRHDRERDEKDDEYKSLDSLPDQGGRGRRRMALGIHLPIMHHG